MSAKHAILGLVIERPSYAWRIAAEARRRLRFACLANSYPYWALEKLDGEGLVRQIYENGNPSISRRVGGQGLYEATVRGVRAFEGWLQSTPGECLLRDDVQFRLAVMRPADVPRLIEFVRHRELVGTEHEQALNNARPADPNDRVAWQSTLNDMTRDAELMLWRGRICWLRSIRETLKVTSAEDRSIKTTLGSVVS